MVEELKQSAGEEEIKGVASAIAKGNVTLVLTDKKSHIFIHIGKEDKAGKLKVIISGREIILEGKRT